MTSYLMFYVPRKFIESFPGGFLGLLTFLGSDLKTLIKILIFNSLTFN